MRTCCNQLGNGTVFVQEYCAFWCEVTTDDPAGDFTDCLDNGDRNSARVGGLSCSVTDDSSANDTSSGDDDTSASIPAYNAPKTTLLAVLCGLVALSALNF